jgi:hypothetical protein
MIKAKARIEQAMRGQMGQPAAAMMDSKIRFLPEIVVL